MSTDWQTAYVGLGSNLGRPRLQIASALKALRLLPGSRLTRVSSVYRNAAVGPGSQPAYLNAVAALDTRLPPTSLLRNLQTIEQAQGRQRSTKRWIARTLDLDLLMHGQFNCKSAFLSLPHPEMVKRNFVLYPLAEIAPTLTLPDGKPVSSLLKKLPANSLSVIHY